MKAAALAVLLLVAGWSPCLAQPAPLEIAGVRLGDDIKHYQGKYDPERAEVELTRQYLTVATLISPPGFRSGYVTYGNCAAPDRIVRIKMNYEDGSREFYEKILGALKKRYGDPLEWRGNPFGTLRVWKWGFKDPNLGDISVILEHYSGEDDSFTKGNSIRISAPGLLDKESACYRASHPVSKPKAGPAPSPKEDLNAYLPR